MTRTSKIIYLLRSFWPSWKFFEDAGWHPELQIQTQIQMQNQIESWRTVRFSNEKIRPWNWFFNPYTNLDLCTQSLLYRSVQLINQNKFIDSTEQLLVQNLVKSGFNFLNQGLRKDHCEIYKISYRIAVHNALTAESEIAFQDFVTITDSNSNAVRIDPST